MGSVADLAKVLGVDPAYLGFLLHRLGVTVGRDGSVDLPRALKRLAENPGFIHSEPPAQMVLALPPVTEEPTACPDPRVANVPVERKRSGPLVPGKHVSKMEARNAVIAFLEQRGLVGEILSQRGAGHFVKVEEKIVSISAVKIVPRQTEVRFTLSEKLAKRAELSFVFYERRSDRRLLGSGLCLYSRSEREVGKTYEGVISGNRFDYFALPCSANYLAEARADFLRGK